VVLCNQTSLYRLESAGMQNSRVSDLIKRSRIVLQFHFTSGSIEDWTHLLIQNLSSINLSLFHLPISHLSSHTLCTLNSHSQSQSQTLTTTHLPLTRTYLPSTTTRVSSTRTHLTSSKMKLFLPVLVLGGAIVSALPTVGTLVALKYHLTNTHDRAV
jgi:hypothetical protein